MGEVPGHHDEVYVYGDSEGIEDRFPPRPGVDPNLFVLDTDEHLRGLSRGNVVPVPQLKADLWWMGKLGARLIEKLEEARTGGRLKRLTESLMERLEEQAPGPLTCSVCGRAASAGGAESLEAGGEEFVLCSDCKTSTFEPADQAVRIWGELDLPPRVLEKALEILGRARDENLVSGRSPRGVAGGAIYIASAIFGEDKPQKKVAAMAGISPSTLRTRYRDLGSELDMLPEEGGIP
ncbi:hypothetical protein AKJ51_01850 [candidate division MSBL1 archaeon SCGC-AAA382A20]|uniref:Transcription factor TFIIB cyclin-like domain-containing protein n=1 Tax=candidate division MSBL1 archaeon SCGC-AAA382A20 TaxID=1698280 RepID=A0A133VL75_9EURY|nr:hypothetical protein AKJ51_01850 [candidate division MSBL1 archaeon SCGC-AAA382A20]